MACVAHALLVRNIMHLSMQGYQIRTLRRESHVKHVEKLSSKETMHKLCIEAHK